MTDTTLKAESSHPHQASPMGAGDSSGAKTAICPLCNKELPLYYFPDDPSGNGPDLTTGCIACRRQEAITHKYSQFGADPDTHPNDQPRPLDFSVLAGEDIAICNWVQNWKRLGTIVPIEDADQVRIQVFGYLSLWKCTRSYLLWRTWQEGNSLLESSSDDNIVKVRNGPARNFFCNPKKIIEAVLGPHKTPSGASNASKADKNLLEDKALEASVRNRAEDVARHGELPEQQKQSTIPSTNVGVPLSSKEVEYHTDEALPVTFEKNTQTARRAPLAGERRSQRLAGAVEEFHSLGNYGKSVVTTEIPKAAAKAQGAEVQDSEMQAAPKTLKSAVLRRNVVTKEKKTFARPAKPNTPSNSEATPWANLGPRAPEHYPGKQPYSVLDDSNQEAANKHWHKAAYWQGILDYFNEQSDGDDKLQGKRKGRSSFQEFAAQGTQKAPDRRDEPNYDLQAQNRMSTALKAWEAREHLRERNLIDQGDTGPHVYTTNENGSRDVASDVFTYLIGSKAWITRSGAVVQPITDTRQYTALDNDDEFEEIDEEDEDGEEGDDDDNDGALSEVKRIRLYKP